MSSLLEKSILDHLLAGDRRSLSKAITLIESQRDEDQILASQLLQSLPKKTTITYRLGISGPPGAGKSSLIETLGLYLIEKGHRVAVLAIDPTSPTSGGSLLGDKTRMEQLSRAEAAYIRPSSSTKNYLGGIAPHTPEIIALLEAANFDVILLETIGIGQNEVDAFDAVDMLCYILSPAGGDELQGLKKGILELVHMVAVNKWDGDLKEAGEITSQHYRSALMNVAPDEENPWLAPVITCSAKENIGMDVFWSNVTTYYDQQKARIHTKRIQQKEKYFQKLVLNNLLQLIQTLPEVHEKIKELSHFMAKEDLPPRFVCAQFVNQIKEKLFSYIKNNV